MSLSLPEFLSARFDEIEEKAKAALETTRGVPARWRCASQGFGGSVVWNGVGQAVVPHAHHRQGDHIAQHDPVFVLDDIAAKRQILAEIQSSAEWAASDDCPDPAPYLRRVATLQEVARILALPYSDHPDYRDEWKQ